MGRKEKKNNDNSAVLREVSLTDLLPSQILLTHFEEFWKKNFALLFSLVVSF